MLTIMILGITGKEYRSWILLLSSKSFCCNSCLVFILYVGLSHIFTPSILVWLIQGHTHTLFTNSGRNIWTTCWSTPVPFVLRDNQPLCNRWGQTQPAPFPELHWLISLAHLLWVFFRGRGLLVSHIFLLKMFWSQEPKFLWREQR